MLTKALDEAQRKAENYFFDIRKQLFEFDEVLNSQRDRVCTERRRALESDSLQSLIVEYTELTMVDILEANIGPDVPKESWDLDKLFAKLQQIKFQEIVEKEAPGLMKEAVRFLVLSNIDRLWKEHLQALKFVQQAVSLRGYAQRDPLIEYKLDGYNLFLEMMAQILRNVIYSIYQFKPGVMKNQEQGENSRRKEGKRKGVDKDANAIGAAKAASA